MQHGGVHDLLFGGFGIGEDAADFFLEISVTLKPWALVRKPAISQVRATKSLQPFAVPWIIKEDAP